MSSFLERKVKRCCHPSDGTVLLVWTQEKRKFDYPAMNVNPGFHTAAHVLVTVVADLSQLHIRYQSSILLRNNGGAEERPSLRSVLGS
jgi:hypothetical protein